MKVKLFNYFFNFDFPLKRNNSQNVIFSNYLTQINFNKYGYWKTAFISCQTRNFSHGNHSVSAATSKMKIHALENSELICYHFYYNYFHYSLLFPMIKK